MKYLKRYNEGGGIPTNTIAGSKTNDMLRHLSTFGEDNERKYDVNDLMDILSFSKGAKPSKGGLMGNVDFNSGTSPADFVSYKTKKKGDTRISEYNEEEGGYDPSVGARGMKEGQLERLAGRPLKGSQEGDFRDILSDPTLLRYFMDMMGEGDMSFRKAKLGKIKSTGREPSGSAEKDSGCVGAGCKDVISGKAQSFKDY